MKPLVSGAAMFNKQTQMLDLHFISFKYRQSYIKRLIAGGDSTKMEYESLISAK